MARKKQKNARKFNHRSERVKAETLAYREISVISEYVKLSSDAFLRPRGERTTGKIRAAIRAMESLMELHRQTGFEFSLSDPTVAILSVSYLQELINKVAHPQTSADRLAIAMGYFRDYLGREEGSDWKEDLSTSLDNLKLYLAAEIRAGQLLQEERAYSA